MDTGGGVITVTGEWLAKNANLSFSGKRIPYIRPYDSMQSMRFNIPAGQGQCDLQSFLSFRSVPARFLLCPVSVMTSGANIPIRILVDGDQSAPCPIPFSYAAPAISSFVPAFGSTRGNQILTIHGKNFGRSQVRAEALE